MTAWLRLLGVLVLVLGIGTGSYLATRAVGDVEFADVAARHARHPEHMLFQAEYYAAASRHYGLIAGAATGILGGLVFGSILLALAAILARQSGER